MVWRPAPSSGPSHAVRLRSSRLYRNTTLIVCSQSTKRLPLALRPGGDRVADLDGVTGDDHAVHEQLEQLPLAGEVRLVEALPPAPAEGLGMGREPSRFGLTASVVREFTFLA